MELNACFAPRRWASLLGAVGLLGLLLWPNGVWSQMDGVYPPLDPAVEARIRKLVLDEKLTGLSVAIVQDGRVIYAGGNGWANRQMNQRASAQTTYYLGSLTKSFTLLGILRLVEQGKVDLDAPLSRYLPDFKPANTWPGDRIVTVRNLLTHHSGLPSDWLDGCLAMPGSPPANQSYILPILNRARKPTPTGLKHTYSNLGFAVLGLVIEAVSGQSFPEYMRQQVFQPLGIRSAGYDPKAEAVAIDLAQGHLEGKPRSEPPTSLSAAGGLMASVEDVAQLMRVLTSGGQHGSQTYLRDSTVAKIFVPQNDTVALDFGYLMGLCLKLNPHEFRLAGEPLWMAHHTGTTTNFSSAMVLLPDRRMGIVLCANDARKPSALRRAGVDILDALLEARYGSCRVPHYPPLRLKRPPLQALKQWPGTFSTEWGVAFVKPKGKNLRINMLGYKFDLLPHDGGLYTLRARVLGGIIKVQPKALKDLYLELREVNGQRFLVRHQDFGSRYFGQQLQVPALSVPWIQRIGDYRIRNLSGPEIVTDLALVLRGNTLCFTFRPSLYDPHLLEMPIRPITDTYAVLDGLGRWQNSELEVLPDGSLRFLGYELVKVK